eukprot:TRINITY_DN21699_c0_g2_i1.p1 TRINITY_DN21699_c0_g2~~TRINITY_DN21699_c0_g2_i1.p1  ORF type:complete len:745 (+),score=74.49 TRINITY_DN21699_c0_g2_i1:72-2306(+)
MAGRAEISRAALLYSKLCSAGVRLTDGWLLPRGRVELQRAIADVDENRSRVLRYSLRLGDEECPQPLELPASVAAVLPSPSGRYSARVLQLDPTKPKPRWCIEFWRAGALIVRVDASKLHEKVLTEGTFGGFSWSRDELQAVYVAETKVPESPSPFAAAGAEVGQESSAKDEEEPKVPGRANWYREDWGEKLGSSDRLALFLVNFSDGTVKRLRGVAEDITPGQPVFWNGDIVYTGWQAGVRKLGALYCSQRPSGLYLMPLSSVGGDAPAHTCLTPKFWCARCPRPAPPTGDSSATTKAPLAFLGSLEGFETHQNCMELYVLEAAGGSPRCLVTATERPGQDGFAGICMDSALPRDCWASGTICFNTFSGARQAVFRVAADGGEAPLRVALPAGSDRDASLNLLAANEKGLLLAWSTPCQPMSAFVRPAEESAKDISLPPLGPCAVVSGITGGADIVEGLRWRVQEMGPAGGGSRFDAILLEPVEVPMPGLILFVHGGPHSVSTTEFQHSTAFLARVTGCAVLLVNYRGSAGFGRQALQSLPGKVGTQDVQDCVASVNAALQSGAFDRNRVGVVGGSHGGFLAAHLIGQHPDLFKAAAMRNPVTNIASMVSATDIPDWCFVEAMGLDSFNVTKPGVADAATLSAMWAKSPMAHVSKVKAPTLVALGMKDRRVPPSQGMEYYHALRASGVVTRLLCYEQDSHPLDSASTDADLWINIAVWLNEHLPVAVPLLAPLDLSRAASFGV